MSRMQEFLGTKAYNYMPLASIIIHYESKMEKQNLEDEPPGVKNKTKNETENRERQL